MRRLFGWGRYANVTATLALVVALGGTSYAAVGLAPNSVGTRQLQDDAVTSAKVANHSLKRKDFKAGALTRGARGPRGARGRAGPAGSKGDAGPRGEVGPRGDSAFPDFLPSGKTLRGAFAMQADVASGQIRTGISFGFSLSAAPTPHYVRFGDPAPLQCVGGSAAAPEAAPGQLCVYEGLAHNVTVNRGVVDPTNDNANVSAPRFGSAVYASCAAGTPCYVEGTWAVTAP